MFTRVFVCVTIVAAVQSQCLNSAVYSSLGFSDSVQTDGTNLTSTDYCYNIYNKAGGSCVSKVALVASWIPVLTNITVTIQTNGVSYDNLFGSLSTKVKNLFGSNDTRANYSDVVRANVSSSIQNCFNSYKSIVSGIYCLITSKSAKNYTTDSGNDVGVKVLANSTLDSFKNCENLMEQYCFLNYGEAVIGNFSLNQSSSSNSLPISKDQCIELRTALNISQDAYKKKLFDTFFYPMGVKFAPSSSIISTVINWFNSRRLEEDNSSRALQSTRTITATTDANGYDVVAEGKLSNMPTSSSTIIKVLTVFGILIPLLAIF